MILASHDDTITNLFLYIKCIEMQISLEDVSLKIKLRYYQQPKSHSYTPGGKELKWQLLTKRTYGKPGEKLFS